MPELAGFFGIVIYMNWRDHNPAHIHALYGDQEALVSLDGAVLAGNVPHRALSMVHEWLAIHHNELLDSWARAQQRQPLAPSSPWSSP